VWLAENSNKHAQDAGEQRDAASTAQPANENAPGGGPRALRFRFDGRRSFSREVP
jgi:hypothetical protein